jgi:endoglucanase
VETGRVLARSWSDRAKYPIFLGEFGANRKAAMESRVTYTRAMRDEAEAHDISWIYWEFASEFGVFDAVTRTYRAQLLAALLGP